MKLGVCLEMFFAKRPFANRIAMAADASYRYGEMWFTDWTFNAADEAGDPKNPAKIRAAAAKAGFTLTNAVIGSPDGSKGGGLTDAENRREWLKRADQTFRFCQEAGIGAAIVCTGNRVRRLSRKAMRHNVLEGLKATAERAEKAGLDLFLEPLNDTVDHRDYFLTSSDEGAQLCRDVGSPRMKLLFDCYHMQIMEGDLLGHIRRNLDVIGHMHAAGHPGRHELWMGETHYPFLIREVEKAGYRGVFALEYMPTLDPAESLRRTRAYLEKEP